MEVVDGVKSTVTLVAYAQRPATAAAYQQPLKPLPILRMPASMSLNDISIVQRITPQGEVHIRAT
ncbi:hypothetical protein DF164_29825 [Burkholderia stagnalis]|nr:hypothetical protein DF164_29825 [Burkholderia stagnalis]RQY68668.1 hypothetical protein DF110_19140 [Burkholderia stagnalis]